MASQFQNRIAGAIVLVALGVIILPGVLDGDKKHYQSEFAAIPIIPTPESNMPTTELPPATQALPDPVVPDTATLPNSGSAQAGNIPPVVQDNSVGTVTNTQPPKNASDNNKTEVPKGKAYVIQLAALTNAAKVEEIKATLSFANYTVFTIPVTAVQGKTTRIFVDPDASKQKLESALPELEKLTGLKGVVKEHKVTN